MNASIEWWDEPERNARLYRHLGCDEGNAPWVVPLDDCPPPVRATEECARCCLILPLRRRGVPLRGFAPDSSPPVPEAQTHDYLLHENAPAVLFEAMKAKLCELGLASGDEAVTNRLAMELTKAARRVSPDVERALRFYAEQKGLGSVLASDGGMRARAALKALGMEVSGE